MHTTRWRKTTVGALVALALFTTACGDDEDEPASSGESPTTTAEEEADATEETTDTTAAEDADGPVGEACGAVPADGEGSFTGMADDPAATAAGNNPELSTLVQAVTAANLGDTLNGEGPFTIFAPVNSAFAAIPEADLNAVLADTELLTSILTLHVVPGQNLDAAALMELEEVETVNGASISLAVDGETLRTNDQANVVCANIETANATVHLIDAVMMPAAEG